MAQQTLMLNIPDDLYRQLKRRAEESHLTIEAELLRLLATTLAINPPDERTHPGEKRHALDILAELPGHLAFQTAEDVDRYVRNDAPFRRVPGLPVLLLSESLPTEDHG